MIHGRRKSHMIFKSNHHFKGSCDKNKLHFNCILLGTVSVSVSNIESRCPDVPPTNSAVGTVAYSHIRQAACLFWALATQGEHLWVQDPSHTQSGKVTALPWN